MALAIASTRPARRPLRGPERRRVPKRAGFELAAGIVLAAAGIDAWRSDRVERQLRVRPS